MFGEEIHSTGLCYLYYMSAHSLRFGIGVKIPNMQTQTCDPKRSGITALASGDGPFVTRLFNAINVFSISSSGEEWCIV